MLLQFVIFFHNKSLWRQNKTLKVRNAQSPLSPCRFESTWRVELLTHQTHRQFNPICLWRLWVSWIFMARDESITKPFRRAHNALFTRPAVTCLSSHFQRLAANRRVKPQAHCGWDNKGNNIWAACRRCSNNRRHQSQQMAARRSSGQKKNKKQIKLQMLLWTQFVSQSYFA